MTIFAVTVDGIERFRQVAGVGLEEEKIEASPSDIWARGVEAKKKMALLGAAAEVYRTNFGHYPNELSDLATRPAEDAPENWTPTLLTLPKDPWGSDFVYDFDEDYFSVSSAGPDRKYQSADDIWDLD